MSAHSALIPERKECAARDVMRQTKRRLREYSAATNAFILSARVQRQRNAAILMRDWRTTMRAHGGAFERAYHRLRRRVSDARRRAEAERCFAPLRRARMPFER